MSRFSRIDTNKDHVMDKKELKELLARCSQMEPTNEVVEERPTRANTSRGSAKPIRIRHRLRQPYEICGRWLAKATRKCIAKLTRCLQRPQRLMGCPWGCELCSALSHRSEFWLAAPQISCMCWSMCFCLESVLMNFLITA